MELSAGRQTLNMKAFISTTAVVNVQPCEFANSTDTFIGLLTFLCHAVIKYFDFIDFFKIVQRLN